MIARPMDNGANHQRPLLLRFWRSASGYWRGPSGWRAWLLCGSLFAIVVAQLVTQTWLNYWNRDFFDALEQHDASVLVRTALAFFPLAALSTVLAMISVWGRMTAQRQWRRSLTRNVLTAWLTDENYRHLGHLNGPETPWNPEYRIAEDARIATDAPIDLVLALFSSLLTVFVFFDILVNVGGTLTLTLAGVVVAVPAYLVVGVIAYSSLVTAAMLFIARDLTAVVQDQAEAEAAFRASANLIRERGEGIVPATEESSERCAVWRALHEVLEQWRRLLWQHIRTTVVTHGNTLIAPILGLILCVPKYLDGGMSLGEVTQAAAAFVTLQGAFNWLVDNFHRMAGWRSSANRVATLLFALDELERANGAARDNLDRIGARVAVARPVETHGAAGCDSARSA